MPNLVGTGLNQVPTNGMLGGLAYQSPDHASIKDLDLKNLSQINSEIADTAVDIFIYDTSNDSDGGAWRHRTSHTSWYNETLNTATRGSRKEFPAVAVIVATSTTIKIYDGDDPDMPLWMFFDNSSGTAIYTNTLTSVSALNGKICWGMISSPVANGFTVVDFISEKIKKYTYAGAGTNHGNFLGNIADRNDAVGWDETYGTTEVPALSQDSVHDIAMTVLPNAPIDDATGLPIPTIAIGVGVVGSGGGGVNVIKDDGTVIDIIAGTGAGGYVTYDVEFGSNNELIHTQAYNNTYASVNIFDNIPSSDISANITYTDARSYPYITSVPNIRGGVNGASTPNLEYVSNSSGGDIAFGFKSTNAKLSLLSDNKTAGTDATKSMVAYITSDYNTGWLHGNCKGAFLSDTDATNVTGTELVTNGTFDTDASGWTAYSTTLTVSNNQLNVSKASGTGYVSQTITTTIGETYVLSFYSSRNSGTFNARLSGVSYSGVDIVDLGWSLGTGYYSYTFTATSTTTYVTFGVANGNVDIDNVSVRLAELDRSVNNKGLQVFGTVNKSAVATGAELVAYSGFSVSNYLQQPYNSDLNFGTGDFFLSIWLNPSSTSSEQYIIDKRSGGADIFELRLLSGGTFRLYVSVSSAVAYYDSSSSLPLNTWSLVQLVRPTGSDLSIYINGVERTNKAYSSFIGRSLTTSSPVTLGLQVDSSGSPATNLKMSLLRISTSAPSPEQIKKIYEDEKVLFQENASCTLYGSSDAVTALAYDEVTERLHVGTSSGRSEFQGLRRINNTTTAVTTAISAYDSFVVEQ